MSAMPHPIMYLVLLFPYPTPPPPPPPPDGKLVKPNVYSGQIVMQGRAITSVPLKWLPHVNVVLVSGIDDIGIVLSISLANSSHKYQVPIRYTVIL